MSIKDNVKNLRRVKSSLQSKVTSVYESGKQAEYDRFWDAYQENGNRTEYRYAFAGDGWTDETFKPKYDIRPINAPSLFAGFSIAARHTSITECLKRAGVTLDTSKCTNMQQMFYSCRAEEIPNIDFGSATIASSIFNQAMSVKKIEITVPESCPLTEYASWFSYCKALEHLIVNGVLKHDLNLSAATLLTHDSLMSVINALKNMFADNIVTDEIVDTNIFFGEPEIFPFEDTFASTGEQIYFVGGDIDEYGSWESHYCVLRDGVYYVVDTRTWGPHEDPDSPHPTLTIGATNLAKLTNEDIAKATERGWTLL